MRRGAGTIMAAAAAGILAAGCTAAEDTNAEGVQRPGATAAAMTSVPAEGGATTEGITVVGSGVAAGEPDVVRIVIGVEIERDEVQPALDEANAATAEVLAVLDEEGIAEEDRQTRDFSVHPVHRRQDEGREQIDGYAVRNLVEVTVRDVDRVGAIVQAAAQAAGDAARIHGVRFDLENDGEQLTAARQAALADARDKAEQYARLMEAELGEPVAIEERSTSTPRAATMMDEAADAAARPVPIETGEQEVTVHVVVRWSIR